MSKRSGKVRDDTAFPLHFDREICFSRAHPVDGEAAYSVSVVDPATFVVVAFVLALIAMVASYIPARRTVRVDPLIALRQE